MITINKRGIWIKASLVPRSIIEKIKRLLTIRTLIINDKYAVTQQYEFYNGFMILPRFSIMDLLQNVPWLAKFKIVANISPGTPPTTPYRWAGEMKNNQPVAFRELIRLFEARAPIGVAGAILKLGAGQGKTFLAMGIINHLQLKTLIVTHNETVLYDWNKLVGPLFPGTSVGLYYGKKKEKDADIVIGIVNSLINLSKSDQTYFKRFGLIIYDEVHMYCQQGFGRIFKCAQATYMLGLSATPNERRDKFDKVAWWHVGPVVDASELEGYTESNIPFTGHVRKILYYGGPDFTEHIVNIKTGLPDSVKMLTNIIADPVRLNCIRDEIVQLATQYKNIFVFSDRKKYLCAIHDAITLLHNPNVPKMTILTGGSSSDDIRAAEDSASIILTTYQYMSVGKSIPKMNAMVLATPRKSHSEQIINRIFRLGANYSITREIVDIVDEKTIFRNQWRVRSKYYRSKSYPIDEIEVNAPETTSIS